MQWTDFGFDPIALDLGVFQIRWYSLAYITGFITIWLYGAHLCRRRGDPALGAAMGDLMVWVILGTILGGRLGFVLFYEPEAFLADPLKIVRLWEGGMAFHGGLIGVVVAIWLFSRSRQVHPLSVGDVLAAGTPVGLFLGRLANFVNGELWGRPTSLPWGIVFDHDPRAGPMARHPSQLYEAMLEGLILFAILAWLAWTTSALRRPGVIAGWFLMLYGLMRFLVEFVREWKPIQSDEALIAGLFTTGQLLSVPMMLIGLLILLLRPRLASLISPRAVVGAPQTQPQPQPSGDHRDGAASPRPRNAKADDADTSA